MTGGLAGNPSDCILSGMHNPWKGVAYSIALAGLALLAHADEAASPPPKALAGAHAHNDYHHKRPLWDALERGFVSIEADVFLVDGQLLVGHYWHELRPERTLESLYLAPLRKHVAAHGGRVFADGERLTLLVDFKTPGAEAYQALKELLGEYSELVYTDDKDRADRKSAPVQVVITGDRPIDLIAGDEERSVALDGRLGDLDRGLSAEVMPLVSESWSSHFKWRGKGTMPEEERERLREIVERVHEQQRLLRFWATPDDPAVWRELRAAGVDVIGADDLERLEAFLRSREDRE